MVDFNIFDYEAYEADRRRQINDSDALRRGLVTEMAAHDLSMARMDRTGIFSPARCAAMIAKWRTADASVSIGEYERIYAAYASQARLVRRTLLNRRARMNRPLCVGRVSRASCHLS